MNVWGIPDWTNERAYGATKCWSESRWRWEFTRRRQDCRKDFLGHKDETYRLWEGFYARSPKAKQRRMLRPDEPGFTADVFDCCKKYGLLGLPNPAIGDQPSSVLRFLKAGRSLIIGRGNARSHDMTMIRLYERNVAVVIDLTAPIGKQLAGIRQLLEWQQRKKIGHLVRSGKKHAAKWLTYLRVLDARESGASLSQIAKTVLKPEARADHAQLARDVLKQAEALCFKWPS
jgi:hypothetical protein